jgi:hypothetical protein
MIYGINMDQTFMRLALMTVNYSTSDTKICLVNLDETGMTSTSINFINLDYMALDLRIIGNRLLIVTRSWNPQEPYDIKNFTIDKDIATHVKTIKLDRAYYPVVLLNEHTMQILVAYQRCNQPTYRYRYSPTNPTILIMHD